MDEHTLAAHIMPPGTLFHNVFHSSAVGMVLITAEDGVYVDANQAFATIVGLEREHLIGQPLSVAGVEPALDREIILNFLRQMRRVGDIPFNITANDGQSRSCVASVQYEEIDGQGYFYLIVQDYTKENLAQLDLLHSDNRFRLFFQSVPLPLLVIDETTLNILDVNPAACRLYGYSPAEFLSLSLNDLSPPADRSNGAGIAPHQTAHSNWIQSSDNSTIHSQLLKDGTTIEASITSYTFILDDHPARLAIVEDVTEKRAAQLALEASEERLRIIADMTADAIWDRNVATGEISWSAGLSAQFGHDSTVSRTNEWWQDHIHPDDRSQITHSMRDALGSDDDYWMGEYRFRRADESYANVLDSGYIARDPAGGPANFMGSMVDITEQLQAAEIATRATLEERQRLAHDLHDTVTQSLYSVSLLAEASRRRAESGDDKAVLTDYIGRLGELTMQTLRQMRLLVYELRPGVLEQVGLAAALRHRLEAVEHRAGIKARLIDETRAPIPNELKDELFWIAQEGLNNSLKHASATTVTVRIRQEEDLLILEVRDNGVGLDAQPENKLGELNAIRRRVRSLNGELTLENLPKSGALFRVTLPVQAGGNKQGSINA